MRIKTTRRFLALVFVLALMVQVALPASAASKTWTSGGVSYTGVVTKSGSTTRLVAIPGTNTTHGGNGTQTVIAVNGYKTMTCTQSFNFPSQFQSQLKPLANSEGMVESLTANRTYAGETAIVPATAASGTYAAAVTFTGYKGSWNVSGNDGSAMSGNIVIAPYSCNTRPVPLKVG